MLYNINSLYNLKQVTRSNKPILCPFKLASCIICTFILKAVEKICVQLLRNSFIVVLMLIIISSHASLPPVPPPYWLILLFNETKNKVNFLYLNILFQKLFLKYQIPIIVYKNEHYIVFFRVYFFYDLGSTIL